MEDGGRNSRGYKKGLWTTEEDIILTEYIKAYGKGKWNQVTKATGLNRGGKSCRLRWLNYLSPNVKSGDFSDEENDLIIRLHNLLGNRWSLIAGRVPGRTDNQVKNHWNSHLNKKLGVKSKAKTRSKITHYLSSNTTTTTTTTSDQHTSQREKSNSSKLPESLPQDSNSGGEATHEGGHDDDHAQNMMMGNDNVYDLHRGSLWFYNNNEDVPNVSNPSFLMDSSNLDHHDHLYDYSFKFLEDMGF